MVEKANLIVSELGKNSLRKKKRGKRNVSKDQEATKNSQKENIYIYIM